MKKLTVADALVETLVAQNVKRIYGIVGDSLNGITAAVHKHGGIDWIHTRHEEVAAFAAGAEANLSGELTVCAGSCGPGNLHLINGLYDCQRNNVPVLAIAAHIPSIEIGTNYFQETHPEILFKDCSVFCELASSPQQMPHMLNMAIQTAIAKRSVAVLVLSGDTALQQDSVGLQACHAGNPKPLIQPNETELEDMAKLLKAGKRVTMLCGHGCQGAHDELLQLAETLKAPIVHALRGKEFVEYDNPYDVGMTGLIGFSSGYYAMEACDTLLLLGTSFPYRQFYPKKANIIQVDIDGAQLGKRVPLRLGVVGDVKATIQALLPKLEKHDNDKHLQKALAHYKKARSGLDDLVKIDDKTRAVHPESLVSLISEKATDDAVFACDVGTPTVWCARYLQLNGKRRLIGSFNHGSMANALPQAIGAQCYDKKRQVIALCGDGGFAMVMGDVLSLTQLNLPVKIAIINNGTLGFVELEMKATGFLDADTELKNPDFAAMANAIGIHGIRVEKPQDLAAAIDEWLAHDGPAILDVVTNRSELIMPPKVTGEQVAGFGIYATKAILSGRGNELIELVESNLWR